MPTKETLFDFIIQNNAIEHIDISYSEVNTTFQKKQIHPCASGHFSALNYALDLAKRNAFPFNHALDFSDKNHSDKSLYWLKTIHLKLMEPITKYGEFVQDILSYIPLSDCGNYRMGHKVLGVSRFMPKPTALKDLMHWWYKDLCNIHQKYNSILNRLKIEDANQLSLEARQKHIQLQCIHPFVDGTGRSARIVENILRLRWGLSWLTPNPANNTKYISEITKYEDSNEWQNILKQNNAK